MANAVVQTESAEKWLWAFDGQQLRPPKREKVLPSSAFVAWHRKEVFKAS